MEEGHTVQHNEYCYAGGLVEYVKWLNTDKVYSTSFEALCSSSSILAKILKM